MQKTILALDPGTQNLGYATLIADTNRIVVGDYYGVLKTSKYNKDGTENTIRDRIDALGYMVIDLVVEIKPHYIAMEDFTEQGKFVGKTYKEMAFLIEHIRLIAREYDVPIYIIENREWKKRLLGAGTANKMQVQHYLTQKVPNITQVLHNQPVHVWDAVGIGLASWEYFSRENALNELDYLRRGDIRNGKRKRSQN